MQIIIKDNWIHIPKGKNLVNESQLQSDLLIPNASYWRKVNSGGKPGPNDVMNIQAYEEDVKEFRVPRHYEVPWKQNVIVQFSPFKFRKAFSLVVYSTNAKPRNTMQVEACGALNADNNDKILCLSCGAGKSVVSIMAAINAHKLPVLIIVNSNTLMDQWEKELRQFVTPDRGVLCIGRVQGSQSDWYGYDIVLAMLHTVIRKKEPPEFYEYFRLVIVDEVHRLGAQTFSTACPLFHAERWGLSATPEREDKMDKVVSLHLGQVAYRYLKQPLTPKVYFVKTGLQVRTPLLRNGMTNTGKLYTMLSIDVKRNKFLVDYVRRAASKGRTLLILGERREQLFDMAEQLKGEGYDTSVHVGGMEKEEARVALTKQIVFATQHIAREGLDRPAFDTMLILIPFGGQGRLQQTLGRILRTMEGKMAPVAVVFVDDMSITQALANKMKRASRALGFITKDVEVV